MSIKLFFSLILLSLCSCVSVSKSSDVYEGISLLNLMPQTLEIEFQKNKLDGVVDVFSNAAEALKKASNKNPLKKLSKVDEGKLIRLVESAEQIGKKYDEGNMHYYVFSQLYLEIPGNINTAINNSGLTSNEKKNMREALKNNIKSFQ